jgi:rhodanese-related sulfurtransferase
VVPNLRAPIILIDGGDGVAERAARRLETLGYDDIAVVAGGTPNWAAAGLTLFKGVNVPSKTLGELAEAHWHPDMLDAHSLSEWRKSGARLRLFDARPPSEFAKMNVPGAACLPNGELAHRFAAAVPDSETPVIVNCAGRTRGIVGAIGLKLIGIENPVFALTNGTQGWALAGEELQRGSVPAPPPALDEAALGASRERAHRLSDNWSIPWLEAATLDAMRADQERTTYLFDVRSAEEFRAGHLPDAVHAPGGQLVQATDQWIGVRRARVVLSDDTGLRAALAAFWLRQLGFEVYVAGLAELSSLAPEKIRQGPKLRLPNLPRTSPEQAASLMNQETHRLLDLRFSQEHRNGHPAGAEWSIRPKLRSPPLLAPARDKGAVLLADQPEVAALAAIDLAELGFDVRLLDGGMAAWRAARLPVETSTNRPSREEAIDFLRFVHDRHDGNLDASRQYLAWEQGLIAKLDTEERAEFRLARPH